MSVLLAIIAVPLAFGIGALGHQALQLHHSVARVRHGIGALTAICQDAARHPAVTRTTTELRRFSGR